MAKTLKLVSAIILIVFLFYIVEDVASTEEEESFINIPFRLTPTIVKCTSSKDCPEITGQPGFSIAVCLGGYCQK
ncbi:unnamed protein product [Trifolium pratense]|uniref:Uncharacterized protein n=1 Tax=Trifolium pratense TaxID=57577 RepID=A0ACB0LGK0_TRIPR|nr:unnamed protein product [Trifolium pratense]